MYSTCVQLDITCLKFPDIIPDNRGLDNRGSTVNKINVYVYIRYM